MVNTILCAIIVIVGLGMYYIPKFLIAKMICQNPDMSDEQVKAVANMMTQQYKK